LACVVKNESNILDAITVALTLLIFLSEVFFPVDDLPGPLPQLAGALPSTQLARLMRAVLHGQASVEALAPGLGLLLAWGVASYGISLWAFRWIDD
jgi:ABC-type multidrug transport system permease subunit